MTRWFPSSVTTVSLYIAHLFQRGYAASTISTAVSIIGYFHKIKQHSDPTSAFVVKKMLVGVSKSRPACDVRLPVTLDILHKLVVTSSQVTSSYFHKVLITAMYLLAFHGFLRISELAVSSANNHVLCLSNVVLHDTSIVVKFSSFKHHKGHPHSIVISGTSDPLCPVVALTRYVQLRGSQPGPLFLFPDNSPVSQSYFRSTLKSSLHLAGYPSATYKSHSFRIGAATVAASRGYSDGQIQRMGRWSSQAFKKYIRIPCLPLSR